MKNYPGNETVLFSQEEIAQRVKELSSIIELRYRSDGTIPMQDADSKECLVVVGILKGALPFFVDLTRELDFPIVEDFMQVASYGDETESQGKVTVLHDLSINVKGRHVLIIEDIADSGRTLEFLIQHMKERGAASVKTCALVDKRSRRVVEIEPDFVGFNDDIGHYYIGYGMDHAQKYRELPYIGCIEQ